MKKIITLALLAVITITANAQFKNNAEAINTAGKQRMLSQRITKDFLLISGDINSEKYKEELDNSLAVFEESHQSLRNYCEKYPDADAAMVEVEEIWYNFREMASSTEYTKSECSYLLTNSAHLLKATNKVVGLLEKVEQGSSDNKDIDKLVNLAGRERMLSQKICMYYAASYLELPSPEIKPSFTSAVNLFDESLKQLTTQKDINTTDITKRLTSAKRNWTFAKKSLDLNSTLKPATVAVFMNNLLKEMDRITGMYVDLRK